jgi:branched-chain amino acid transport system substrate-binding protein
LSASLSGEPEYLAPLKDEAPPGWLVTGYPWSEIATPVHDSFLKAYVARFKEPPNIGSLIGYTNVLVLARAIEMAGSTKTDDLIKAMERLKVDTPVGPVAFRALGACLNNRKSRSSGELNSLL